MQRKAKLAIGFERRSAILPEPLSIENGDSKRTAKLKRAAVMKKVQPLIDDLYRQGAEERGAGVLSALFGFVKGG